MILPRLSVCLRAAPLLVVILGLTSLSGGAAAASVTYNGGKTVKVNGLQMRIWKKPVQSGGAARIASANGRLWFAEQKTGKIVRFGLTGQADIFDIPSDGIVVQAVAAGPNNDIWLAGFNKGQVGRVSASGQATLFSTGTPNTRARGMTLGLDGNLWSATDARGLGRTTPAGATKFLPVGNNATKPSAVTIGGDGRIWYVQRAGTKVGRMTPGGQVKEFKVFPGPSGSFGITTGPDGRIWFCDPKRKRIGRINLNGGGVTYFKKGLTGTPISIVTGPDNQLYFGQKEGRIGRISVKGKITQFPIPGVAGTNKFPVRDLTVGPDGNIWFVNHRYSQVGQLRLDTPSLDCTKKVWDNLVKCGWPGPGNTGYPAGTALKNTPSRTITQDNTVIDGERIGPDGLMIDAKNVVVKNSHITKQGGGNGSGVIKILPGASATIVRNRLDGNNATHSGIWYEGARLVARANNIFGINDGIFVWDAENFTIEDNYLHDFTENAANGHVDGFQTEGASNGIIRHNVFEVTQGQTSAIAIWNSRRDSSNILVENNLITGGGFSVYAHDYHPSDQNPQGGYSVTNIRFLNNKFSTVHYPCVGAYGVWFPRGAPTDGWRRLGNVVLETGQNIDTQNPVVDGWECR